MPNGVKTDGTQNIRGFRAAFRPASAGDELQAKP